VMNSLATGELESVSSSDIDSFPSWLNAQRTSATLLATSLSCTSGSPPIGSAAASDLPKSEANRSERLQVDIPRNLPVRSLRHLVLIGVNQLNEPTAGAITSAANCNHEKKVSMPSGEIITPRVRCLVEEKYRMSWIVAFCDPEDCATDLQQRLLSEKIAKDEQVALPRNDNADAEIRRGPFSIEVVHGLGQ
jgi:hypothetical protein